MKKFTLPFAFILFVFVSIAAAQETVSWTQIETENKEISVSLPAGFLVDATTKTRNQTYRLFGFQNGVSMEIRVSQPENPEKNLNGITERYSRNAKVSAFKFNGVSGKNFVSKSERYYNAVHLAFKDNFYTFSIRAANDTIAETDRFLCSIKISGKPLFTCKENFPESKQEAVSLSSLKTSPKVLEALKRKQEGKDGKIFYALDVVSQPDAADKNPDWQPPIMLERGAVRPGALRVDGNIIKGVLEVKLRAMLLANGQIGDITVLSNLDRDYVKKFVEAARKSKFIPAELDGKPVDSEYTIAYTIETF